MLLIEITFVIIFLCFFAFVLALFVMRKNRKSQASLEKVNIRAEVVKTSPNINNMSVDTINNYDHTDYFIEFKTDTNKKIVLGVSMKVFNKTLPGFYGDLSYKGSKLVSFSRLESHETARLKLKNEEDYFFIKKAKRSNSIDFYCDSPSLDVCISCDEALKLDIDEVFSYIDRMLENNVENHFGLDNKEMVIQFFNDGEKDEVFIDIPCLDKNGSYQAIMPSIAEVKSIVKAYYKGENVLKLADFTFIKI